MPGTGAIRWGDISFRVRQRPPTEPPILTRRTRQQGPSPTRRRDRRARASLQTRGQAAVPVGGGRARAGLETTRRATHQRPSPTGVEGTGGTGGPGRGAGGRWQGQGGPRDRPLRAAGSRVAISRAGRRPPAHTAARPIKVSHAAAGTPAALNEPRHRKWKAYSPRNALIAGISRTACTRPAR